MSYLPLSRLCTTGVPFVIVISKADTLDYTLARNALAPSEDLKTAYLTGNKLPYTISY